MFSFDAEFNFTRIRQYHPEIQFIAESKIKRNEPINSLLQSAYIDVDSDEECTKFLNDYADLLKSYNLQDENVLDILFLTQKTYSDIELASETGDELLEADTNLSFLIDVVKMQESHKAKKGGKSPQTNKFPNLSLMIQNLDETGAATLRNPMVTDYLIKQLIKAFKNKSYNSQLAYALVKFDNNGHEEDIELTSSNLIHAQKQLNYRNQDIKRFCTAQTASRIHSYLNEQTPFSSPTNGLLSKQARFIFDLLQLFNLLKNIINLKDIPRDKSKLEPYKTSIIKTLIKNHHSLRKEAK